MHEEHAHMAGAERAFGHDEIPLHQPAGFGIDDAGDLHPVDERNHHGDDPEARLQKGCQHDGEKQCRKGHHQIGEAHQDVARQSAEITGDDADEEADRHRDAIGDKADDQRSAGAEEQAREEVAAERVGA